MRRNATTLETPAQRVPALSSVCGGVALFVLIVGSLAAVLLLDATLHPEGFPHSTAIGAAAFGRWWFLVVLLSWLFGTGALLLRRYFKQVLPLTGGSVCLILLPFLAITSLGENALLHAPPVTTLALFVILDAGAIYAARRFAFTARETKLVARP